MSLLPHSIQGSSHKPAQTEWERNELLLHGERQGDTVKRVYGIEDIVEVVTQSRISHTFGKSNCHTHEFRKTRGSSGKQGLVPPSQREQLRLQKSLN